MVPDAHPSLAHATREIEAHVAQSGWDAAPRLFALIVTAQALAEHPELADELPPDVIEAQQADPAHLTAVEQEHLPSADPQDLLAHLAWPPGVAGCALALERVVLDLPDDAAPTAADLPADPAERAAFVAAHPARRDLRIVAAVMRDGSDCVAIRSRQHDTPDQVAVAPGLVPDLTAALAASFA